jgi:hypothetical protein
MFAFVARLELRDGNAGTVPRDLFSLSTRRLREARRFGEGAVVNKSDAFDRRSGANARRQCVVHRSRLDRHKGTGERQCLLLGASMSQAAAGSCWFVHRRACQKNLTYCPRTKVLVSAQLFCFVPEGRSATVDVITPGSATSCRLPQETGVSKAVVPQMIPQPSTLSIVELCLARVGFARSRKARCV